MKKSLRSGGAPKPAPRREKRASPAAAKTPVYIDRGEPLPQSYAENRIVAMVRSPEQIYVYWDVETEVRVAGRRCVVRVHEMKEGRFEDHPPSPEALNWYFRVTPNRTYRFELLEKRRGRWHSLAFSDEVTTPVRWAGQTGLRVPEEILHAARHPISRDEPTPDRPVRVKFTRMGVLARPDGPEHRAPELAAAKAAAPAASRRAAPRSAPPVPIPAPTEKVFGAYTGGTEAQKRP